MSALATQAALSRFDASGAVGFSGPDARLSALRQRSPIRFLRPVPETGDPATVVLVNTAGGIVGGDHLSMTVSADDRAAVLATGQAAEKIYRSDGEDAEISIDIAARDGAVLEFLPQGTILFDGARLGRRTILSADRGATLLYGEILHFGRTAMGESFTTGALLDRTDLWIDGRRVLVDALRLDDDVAATMSARAALDGATAMAVIHCLSPMAPAALDAARDAISDLGTARAGAACFEGGPMVARMISADGAGLRRDFAHLWSRLRGRVLGRPERMPRIWSI